MNRRKIELVIAFSIAALIGSIVIQSYWIAKLYDQNQILFQQNVNQSLKYLAMAIEQEEQLIQIDSIQPKIIRNFSSNLERHKTEVNQNIIVFHQATDEEKKIVASNSGQTDRKISLSEDDSVTQVIMIDNQTNFSFSSDSGFEQKTTLILKINGDSIITAYDRKADSLIKVLNSQRVDLQHREIKLETTVDQLVWEMNRWGKPFLDSIPQMVLDKVLTKTRIDFKLPTDFSFAIIDSTLNKMQQKSEGFSWEANRLSFFTKLFPGEMVSREQYFLVQFPSDILVFEMVGPIVLSLLFTLVFAFGLFYIIRNLLHHRKISQVQTDFINNMTHEFKTPIATISLASDSILNKAVISDTSKVAYFSGMIKKENLRMNRLVEQILMMARMEEKNTKIKRKPVDLHRLLDSVIEISSLKLPEGGKTETYYQASAATVLGDELHLSHMFVNLLDNAIKYSPSTVYIKIETFNEGNMILVRITDHGIGIDKKDIPHIFQKFYRIESGNVHNVKGYGLGLSYVKSVVDKHKGAISVNSELSKGSVFEVKIPLKQ
jgi:two-component system phosphate regulon sensor histidine kinase PhoR